MQQLAPILFLTLNLKLFSCLPCDQVLYKTSNKIPCPRHKWKENTKQAAKFVKNIELSIHQKVASTECDPDQPSIVWEEPMASEQDCVDLCNVYANIASLECTFAAWEKKTLMGTCHLYNEPFSTYLSHCAVISGPPDVSGCLVEHPDENSCHGVR